MADRYSCCDRQDDQMMHAHQGYPGWVAFPRWLNKYTYPLDTRCTVPSNTISCVWHVGIAANSFSPVSEWLRTPKSMHNATNQIYGHCTAHEHAHFWSLWFFLTHLWWTMALSIGLHWHGVVSHYWWPLQGILGSALSGDDQHSITFCAQETWLTPSTNEARNKVSREDHHWILAICCSMCQATKQNHKRDQSLMLSKTKRKWMFCHATKRDIRTSATDKISAVLKDRMHT